MALAIAPTEAIRVPLGCTRQGRVRVVFSPVPEACSGRRAALRSLCAAVLIGPASFAPGGLLRPLPSVALEVPPIFPILSAQTELAWVANKDDVETFITMVRIGLPSTGRLSTPPIIQFNLFKTIEASMPEADAGPFMDAAIEYIEYCRDANDLVDLARGARRQGAPDEIVTDYITRAVDASVGAKKAVDAMAPLVKKL